MTLRFTIELRRLQRDSHDKCSLCGRPFRSHECSHSGYSKDGLPIYVGDCCQWHLSETAARYSWEPRRYEQPSPKSALWRYMDFAKFTAILKDKALFFPRADLLGDRFEGAKGVIQNKTRWNEHYLRYFRQVVRTPPPGNKFNLSDEQVEKEAQRLLLDCEILGKEALRSTYVSCWHESEVESEALWRLYCAPPTPGLAIRTTCDSLNGSLGDDPDISIGRVQYINFQRRFVGISDASIFRKRQSLSHEKEVRAVIHGSAASDAPGKFQPVDLGCLLTAVVISPFAPVWFESVLKETMQRFGVSASIVTSELLSEPFF